MSNIKNALFELLALFPRLQPLELDVLALLLQLARPQEVVSHLLVIQAFRYFRFAHKKSLIAESRFRKGNHPFIWIWNYEWSLVLGGLWRVEAAFPSLNNFLNLKR